MESMPDSLTKTSWHRKRHEERGGGKKPKYVEHYYYWTEKQHHFAPRNLLDLDKGHRKLAAF